MDYLMFYVTPVLIMTSLAVLAYMISKLVKDPQLTAWAKIEVYQVIYSLALLIGILILTDLFNNTFVPFLVKSTTSEFGSNVSSFDVSVRYLDTVASDGLKLIGGVLATKTVLHVISSVVLPVDMSAVGASFSVEFPIADLSCLDKAMGKILYLLTPMLSSVYAQLLGIKFFQITMYTFFLPVGILLRIFPYTRDAGAYLIALAIGFYVFFPFLYTIDYIYYDQVREQVIARTANTQTLFDDILDEWEMMKAGMNDNLLKDVMDLMIKAFAGAYGYEYKKSIMFPIITLPVGGGFLLLFGIFLPTLNIVITVSFIRALRDYMIRRL